MLSDVENPSDSPTDGDGSADEASLLMQILQRRQTILPKRLIAPGPTQAQQIVLFEAAATAPDHHQVLPWRFMIFPQTSRVALGELFAQALHDRDPAATPEQMRRAEDKALRSPFLMLLVVDESRGDQDIDLNERLLSAGCAVQNILSAATAMGFGSSLISGKAMKSLAFKKGLGLSKSDHAICFLSVGTVETSKPGKNRPCPDHFVSVWAAIRCPF